MSVIKCKAATSGERKFDCLSFVGGWKDPPLKVNLFGKDSRQSLASAVFANDCLKRNATGPLEMHISDSK